MRLLFPEFLFLQFLAFGFGHLAGVFSHDLFEAEVFPLIILIHQKQLQVCL